MVYRRMAPAVAAAAVLAGAAAFAQNGTPINTGSRNQLTLAVYGDAPYGTTPTDTTEFDKTPAFIASINSDPKVDLVLHVGDIHSGKQFCTEAYDRGVFGLWLAYKDPVIYTPGDNEWTDCHKAGEGGHVYSDPPANTHPVDYADGDPVENLTLIRSIFFPMPGYSLGGRKKQVLTQATSYAADHPEDAAYVENVMWEQSRTVFVTLNVPGGSNNDADAWFGAPVTQRQIDERTLRTAADLRWLDAAFVQAARDGADAVLIALQADMWDLDGKTSAHLTNYQSIVASIAAHARAFGRPVLLINGDSHEYVSDNPLVSSSPLYAYHNVGFDVPNFRRLVVHGSTEPLEWLRMTVTPGADGSGPASFGPFAWERIHPVP